LGGVNPTSAVLGREIGVKGLFDLQALEDAIEDGQQSDAVRVEVVAMGLGPLADLGG
jgi:hypothetical protein